MRRLAARRHPSHEAKLKVNGELGARVGRQQRLTRTPQMRGGFGNEGHPGGPAGSYPPFVDAPLFPPTMRGSEQGCEREQVRVLLWLMGGGGCVVV